MMEHRIKTRYHSTDELLDMLRNELEYGHHSRPAIIRALEDLTGDDCDDDDWDNDPDMLA